MNMQRLVIMVLTAVLAVASSPVADGRIVRKVLRADQQGENLLKDNGWRGFESGFERQGDVFVCDNGSDGQVRRGVSQTVVLNQSRPEPIIASAWSKAQDVTGGRNSDYSLYLDLTYTDGTQLWGQVDTFGVGAHDWEKAEVMIFPAKAVKSVSFHMLLRRHAGKAWFRDANLQVLRPPSDTYLFDGVPVTVAGDIGDGFSIRDVAADGDYIELDDGAIGVKLKCVKTIEAGVTFFDLELTGGTDGDRAVSLVYSIKAAADGCRWLEDPRRSVAVVDGAEYVNAGGFSAGSNGRLSKYPFAAIAGGEEGIALGIDMARPAFFRAGYNAGTEELFLVYDISLTKEKPAAKLRFCKFDFDGKWGFRGALARYYDVFGSHFRSRTPRQGLWMPFAKISEVKGWEDFGFAFKEGNNETAWDDAHDIVTFRYTEPMTWWMRMPKDTVRTYEAAIDYAGKLAAENDAKAKALLTSGYHDATGAFAARILDTPWCDGAVWSMNSMPQIAGDVTDFANKWNDALVERLYGDGAKARLDGEYIDSSEGYVTDELDFRRDHFSAAATPLTFSLKGRKPAIFRGLIVFEYTRAIAKDIHGRGKLMMANSTPIRLCWLAPMLDVMGTETNWNPGGQWRPMSDSDLLYRRAMCGPKPYCFLMNAEFEKFSHEKVEKYMKRSLAYGMYPGFFSHNASQGHYFTRAELYERDRELFKKYVPLCKLVGEAGWQPVTNARSSDEKVYIERFGRRYLTVFNDSSQKRTAVITVDGLADGRSRELVDGGTVKWKDGRAQLTLGPEDIAVIELPQS